jgi:hypothetical protein
LKNNSSRHERTLKKDPKPEYYFLNYLVEIHEYYFLNYLVEIHDPMTNPTCMWHASVGNAGEEVN